MSDDAISTLKEIRENIEDEKSWRVIDNKIKELESKTKGNFLENVMRSHDVICAVKRMESKAAYGQNPFMYYALAVCAEAGEMANKMVKALRNGDDDDKLREAVSSELPDVIIYSVVLAHVADLNLEKSVNDKVEVVIERAKNGYYGNRL